MAGENIIRSDRSRVECFEKCPRKRYWQYEFEGVGLVPSGDRNLKLDARIGQGVHDGVEFGLKHHREDYVTVSNSLASMAAGFGAGRFMMGLSDDGIEVGTLPEQMRTEVYEGVNIVVALVYAWLRLRLPYMLREGDILAVEQEMAVDFPVGGDTVRFMARPDILWRRRSDGAVFIRNLKTVRDPGTIWREQWGLDMQTLTEPLVVDEFLKREAVGMDFIKYGEGQPCAGVIIDGLTTGAVLDYPKGSGKYYHNTPLLYAWTRPLTELPNGGLLAEPEWYARYEWSCTGEHKMGNGHKCLGGRTHKLSGVHKESIAAKYPGEGAERIFKWIDHLIEVDRPLVENEIIELPPIIRSEYAIARWKRQVLHREVEIHNKARICNIAAMSQIDEPIEPGDPATFDQHLDWHFPMHTASGNCLRPGRCFAYDLCHGSAAASPLESGYKLRTPHHEEEKNAHAKAAKHI